MLLHDTCGDLQQEDGAILSAFPVNNQRELTLKRYFCLAMKEMLPPFNSIINEIIRSEIDIIYTNALGIIRNKNIYNIIWLHACYMPLLHISHFVAGPLR